MFVAEGGGECAILLFETSEQANAAVMKDGAKDVYGTKTRILEIWKATGQDFILSIKQKAEEANCLF